MLLFGCVLLLSWRAVFPTQQLLYISDSLIQERLKLWQIKRSAPLLAEEKERVIEELVLQQLLVKESLKLGFDQTTQVQARFSELITSLSETDAIEEPVKQSIYEQAIASDTTIHSFLINALEQHFRQTLAFDAPDEEARRAHYNEHQTSYYSPAKLTLHHVFFEKSTPQERVMKTQAAIVPIEKDQADSGQQESSEVSKTQITPENAYKLGDTFLGGYSFNGATNQQLENQFGKQFVHRISQLPIEKWSSPIESPFGYHLIWLENKVEAAPRPYADVKQLIENKLLRDAYEQARKEKIDSLIGSYDIVVSESYALPSRFQKTDGESS